LLLPQSASSKKRGKAKDQKKFLTFAFLCLWLKGRELWLALWARAIGLGG